MRSTHVNTSFTVILQCACCGVILDHTGDYQLEVNDEQLTKRHDFDPYHQDHIQYYLYSDTSSTT